MELMVLGSGGAFTLDNYHTNFLLKDKRGNKHMLIDCGSDIKHSMNAAGYMPIHIDSVYISHIHDDHAGGLPWFGFAKFFNPKDYNKPELYTSELIINDLWERSLAGPMSSIPAVQATLETFFQIYPIKLNSSFMYSGCSIIPIQMYHVHNGFSAMPCFGLKIKTSKSQTLITTDVSSIAQLTKLYNDVDLIFQDCENMYDDSGKPVRSGAHVHYEELKLLTPKIKKKMWLCHYQDGTTGNGQAIQDGFLGFVNSGTVFDI